MMELTRQISAVLFVFAVLAAVVYLLRRYGAGGAAWIPRKSGALEVLEQVSLGPGHRLHLVRVADRAILIATHGSGSTLLETLPCRDGQLQLTAKERP